MTYFVLAAITCTDIQDLFLSVSRLQIYDFLMLLFYLGSCGFFFLFSDAFIDSLDTGKFSNEILF